MAEANKPVVSYANVAKCIQLARLPEVFPEQILTCVGAIVDGIECQSFNLTALLCSSCVCLSVVSLQLTQR